MKTNIEDTIFEITSWLKGYKQKKATGGFVLSYDQLEDILKSINWFKEKYNEQIAELKEEIESLKFCGNCKHYVFYCRFENDELPCQQGEIPTPPQYKKCDKWEKKS